MLSPLWDDQPHILLSLFPHFGLLSPQSHLLSEDFFGPPIETLVSHPSLRFFLCHFVFFPTALNTSTQYVLLKSLDCYLPYRTLSTRRAEMLLLFIPCCLTSPRKTCVQCLLVKQ